MPSIKLILKQATAYADFKGAQNDINHDCLKVTSSCKPKMAKKNLRHEEDYIFSKTTPCGQLKFNRSFGETRALNLLSWPYLTRIIRP
jgi:hypothetical protein